MRNYIIQYTYVDKDDPWLGILEAESFTIHSTINRLKGYDPCQLVFGRDIILSMQHNVDWEFIPQKKQTEINKENIRENNK